MYPPEKLTVENINKNASKMPLISCRIPISLHHTRLPTTKLIPINSMSSSSSSHSPSPIQESAQKEAREASIAQVLKYHDQTKHSFTNYARGPRGLDWANQPNPFRRYVSSPLISLLHPSGNQSPLYSELFNSLPSPHPVSYATISQFFYDSLALSAWKTTGFSTWSLRVNPSSGNLHPTEAYLISPPIESICSRSFVAHYAPKEHSLEIRAEIPSEFFAKNFPKNSFFVGLSSIFWREAWKYGERAFRYCNHDVGHAIAAVAMAAAGLGWDVKVLDGLGYAELKKLMGLDHFPEFKFPDRPVKGRMPEIEFEHPDCVLLVFPSGLHECKVDYKELSSEILEFSGVEWKGKPNLLSKEHVCWDIIYRTAEAAKKPLTMMNGSIIDSFQSSGVLSDSSYKGFSLRDVVRKRRSAVDMDGKTSMAKETFYQILLHCMPSGSGSGDNCKRQLALPFRALGWECEVHAALFVHRVVGLPSGLYFLVRNENHLDGLRKATRSEFKWEKPDGCPNDLPLYELARGDCQELSKRLSCHQDIASDGCFSLGMIAHFEPTLREKGAWMYPRLFWETGVLGQVLYLEAHAVGISATGIGCFFDDPVHEVLGLEGSEYQSLYHFTVGVPVADKRIMSLAAYPGPNVDA
ncbi:PREDICTED: uncharacterized protein LOC109171564 [Ipomoea nil]|uniref:uncharacterized protein LOC109171564 n=1 Tax=Ipomoea nil TaxID=35883 RepID=UPI0009014A0C|nr:PREDICTED: uncharacterized protein LOC109171564 [Ipomoea nil]